MSTYSSVISNLPQEKINISNKLTQYINIKNAVKILEVYSNWKGYIKIYTEIGSNFEVGDIVYITYATIFDDVNSFNLENPSSPYTKWSMGYEILYVNNSKNEIVLNREYNDITPGKLLKYQYLSKVSVRGGLFTGGEVDGLAFYKSDIYSGVSFTQGIFKYCNISDIEFSDKYTTVKTLYTTDKFSSKFKKSKSKTATVYRTSRQYYNTVQGCSLYNCDINNGQFDNTIFYGNSNYIKNGIFSGSTISGYTINDGKFYNSIIESNCNWINGFWNNTNGTDDFRSNWINGVWNNGHFTNSIWSGGTFNNGTFTNSTWVNGIFNDGVFSGSTWNSGLVRNADFYNSTWSGGTYNKGKFIDSIWLDGTFNNGTFSGSTLDNGSIKGGNFIDSIINDGKIYNGNLNRMIINGGKFYNSYTLSNSTVNDATIHNGHIKNSTITNGTYYNGYYDTVIFTGGTIKIYNGKYDDCILNNLTIINGNFTYCETDNAEFYDGIFTNGSFKNGYWHNGIMNDSNFSSDVFAGGDFYGGRFSGDTSSPPDTANGWSATWSGGTFHYGYWKGVYRSSSSIDPYPKYNYTQDQPDDPD